MKRKVLAMTALLSSVVLLAGCNNTPEEEVVVDEVITSEDSEVIEEPNVEVVAIDDELSLEDAGEIPGDIDVVTIDENVAEDLEGDVEVVADAE